MSDRRPVGTEPAAVAPEGAAAADRDPAAHAPTADGAPAGHARADDGDDRGTIVRNEFAVVCVRARQGRRAGIEIEDVKTGQSIVLGPLELESLAYARHHDLFALLDPSATRWRADADIDGSVDLL